MHAHRGSTTINQVMAGLMSESPTTYEIFGDIIFSFLSYLQSKFKQVLELDSCLSQLEGRN